MNDRTLFDRFLALPRAAQWLLMAAAFVLAFLAWDMTLHKLVKDWDDQSDAIRRKVAEVRSSSDIAASLDSMRTKDLINAFGRIEPPGSAERGRTALINAVNEVIANTEIRIEVESFDTTDGGRLTQSAATGITQGNKRLRHVDGEFSFVATPEDALKAIAQLERSVAIECISTVRITKANAGKVQVRLTMESWVVDDKSA